MAKLNSFRDLKVYQKLKELHLEVHRETLQFPKFEMMSWVRRSGDHRTLYRLSLPKAGEAGVCF